MRQRYLLCISASKVPCYYATEINKGKLVPEFGTVSVSCFFCHSVHLVAGNKDQIVLDGNAYYPKVIFLNAQLFSCCTVDKVFNIFPRQSSSAFYWRIFLEKVGSNFGIYLRSMLVNLKDCIAGHCISDCGLPIGVDSRRNKEAVLNFRQ